MNIGHTHHRFHSVFLCVLCATAVSNSSAGPLAPPAGPVAPTPGPEPRFAINATNTPGDADSTFRIAQPGSYYLTGNIIGEVGKHGIEIAAGGVTIDLMGFDLVGVVGSLNGISSVGTTIDNVDLRHGTVRNWGEDGVDLTAASGTNCRVTDIFASSNGVVGIIGTVNAVIAGCITEDNGSHGIVAQGSAAIVSCTSFANLGDGIRAGTATSITGCSVYANEGDGINASDSASITGCTSYSNTRHGIIVNTTGTVIGCTVQFNNARGISTNDACVISNCTVRFNQTDGIYVTDDSIVTGNTCTFNGSNGDGAGIHAVGIGNRIEENHCANADRGIDVDSTGNFIARNTCAGNTTNWTVAAGNACLVVVVTPNVLINGDSGGASPGSTNPNANFTH